MMASQHASSSPAVSSSNDEKTFAPTKVMRRVRRDIVHTAKWLRLGLVTYQNDSSPDKPLTWETVERTTRHPDTEIDGADVAAIVNSPGHALDRHIALVLNYRPPVDKYVLELPAGLLDAGETAEVAAARELKEETGLTGKIESISPVCFIDPWKSTESAQCVHMTIDLADLANQTPTQDLEDNESITVVYLPLDGLIHKLRAIVTAHKHVVLDEKLWTFALGLQIASSLQIK